MKNGKKNARVSSTGYIYQDSKASQKSTGLPKTSDVVEAGKNLVIECAKKKAAKEACSNMGWPGSIICEKGVEMKFGKMNCPFI